METQENKPIRTLVVDDEPIACEGLRMLLAKDPDIELIDTCTMGIEAIKKIRLHRPDLLFLDIQMPKVTGFDVLEALTPDERPITVFVTAYDQYALKAFEVNAIDYLMKPFDDARFAQTLDKAKRYFRQSKSLEFKEKLQQLLDQVRNPAAIIPSKSPYLTRLTIKNAGEILFVKVSDIDWITADDYYVNVFVKDKKHLLRESLNNLEEQLDPAQFLRIHRCTIMNIDRIKSIQSYFNNEYIVLTHSGEKFKVSRSKKEALKNLTGI
jgi:two-component system LytT family response regulator